MITSQSVLQHSITAFNGEKYIQLQQQKIKERISKFPTRLYLEIGGKFLYDTHAQRVLPGYILDSKLRIFRDITQTYEVIYCVNANDLLNNRQLFSTPSNYWEETIKAIQDIKSVLNCNVNVSINLVDGTNAKIVDKYIEYLNVLGIDGYKRYVIEGYPMTKNILSENGFGKDQYIPVSEKLVYITGAASNSGKMSTALGQIFHESSKGNDSGYAKFETFPIHNIDINHPVNLAYEAATADIGDYNMIDKYHFEKYGVKRVNYNRDVSAFTLIKQLSSGLVSPSNYINSYNSPTDMGINMAGECITDIKGCALAGLEEIKRRKIWFYEQAKDGNGNFAWVDICDSLIYKAHRYIESF